MKNEIIFRELFDSMSSGVVIYEAVDNGNDFIIKDFNHAAEKIENIKKEDVIGKSVLDCFHGVKEFGLFKVFQEVYQTGKTQKHPISLYQDQRIAGWKENYVFKLPSGEVVAVYDDVTQHKQAEEALKKSESMLRQTEHITRVGGWEYDVNKQRISWTDEVYNLHGVNKEEYDPNDISKNIQFYDLEDRNKIHQAFQESLKKGKSYDLEVRFITARGEHRWVRTIGNPVLANGEVVQVIGNIMDITKDKEAEIKLNDYFSELSVIYDNTPIAMLLLDNNRKIRKVNGEAAKFADRSTKEMIGMVGGEALRCLNALDDIKGCGYGPKCEECKIRNAVLDTFKDGKNREKIEVWLPFPSEGKSKEKCLLVSTALLKFNKEDRVLVSVQDITEQKLTEKALRESEEKYRLLVETTQDIILLHDMEGRITYVNQAGLDFAGFAYSETIGKSITEFVPTEYLPHISTRHKKRAAGNKQVYRYETIFINKNGCRINIEVNSSPIIRQGKATEILIIARDITERKQAQKKLKKAMDGTIETIAKIVDTRDPYTSGHQQRVTQLSVSISREFKISKEKTEGIRIAALIHDIGKISIPSEILTKPSKLTDLEFNLIKSHPQIGHDILQDVEFPYPIARIILQHHERINGSGYPNNLLADQISLEAKIIGVSDVVEAMSSHRPYRPALGIDKALEEISKNRGVLYDPEVVDVCISLFKEKKFEFK